MSETFHLVRPGEEQQAGSVDNSAQEKNVPAVHLVPPPTRSTPAEVLQRAEKMRAEFDFQFNKFDRLARARASERAARALEHHARDRGSARQNEKPKTPEPIPILPTEEPVHAAEPAVPSSSIDAGSVVVDSPAVPAVEHESVVIEGEQATVESASRSSGDSGDGDGPSEPPRRNITQEIKAAEQLYTQEQRRFYEQRARIKALSGDSSIGLLNRMAAWRNRDRIALAENAAAVLMQRMKDIRRTIDGLQRELATLLDAIRDQRISLSAAQLQHPNPLKIDEMHWTPADLREPTEMKAKTLPADSPAATPIMARQPLGEHPTPDEVNAYYQQGIELARNAQPLEELRRLNLQKIQERAEAARHADRTQVMHAEIAKNHAQILQDLNRNGAQEYPMEQQLQRVMARRAKIQSLAQQVADLKNGGVMTRWLNSGERRERETELAGLRKMQAHELEQAPQLLPEAVRRLIPRYEKAVTANDQPKIAYLEGRLSPVPYEELPKKAAGA